MIISKSCILYFCNQSKGVMGERKHNYFKDILRIAENTSYHNKSYYDLGPILMGAKKNLWGSSSCASFGWRLVTETSTGTV